MRGRVRVVISRRWRRGHRGRVWSVLYWMGLVMDGDRGQVDWLLGNSHILLRRRGNRRVVMIMVVPWRAVRMLIIVGLGLGRGSLGCVLDSRTLDLEIMTYLIRLIIIVIVLVFKDTTGLFIKWKIVIVVIVVVVLGLIVRFDLNV